jgi:phospholipid-translocating ATPase
VLAAVYPRTTPYKVRGDFFDGFGQNPTWWMTLIFIVICVYVLKFSASAFRKAIFLTDTDVFQELEHDEAHREQFKKAAAPGLRRSWHRYSNGPVVARKEVDNIELIELNG